MIIWISKKKQVTKMVERNERKREEEKSLR